MIIADSIYVGIPNELEQDIYNAGFIDMDHRRSKPKALTLMDRVALLSKNSEVFDPSEWILTGAEYKEIPVSCICGQSNLKHRYILTNQYTNYSISVGGNCLVNHFFQEAHQDIIDFCKESLIDSYQYLGHKYDAFVYSSLGFKKSVCYFKLRQTKQKVPIHLNHKLRTDLTISLDNFNSKNWHNKLERANHLLSVFKKNAVKKLYQSPDKNHIAVLGDDPISNIKKRVIQIIDVAKQVQTLNEKNAQIQNMERLLTELNMAVNMSKNKKRKEHPLANIKIELESFISSFKQKRLYNQKGKK